VPIAGGRSTSYPVNFQHRVDLRRLANPGGSSFAMPLTHRARHSPRAQIPSVLPIFGLFWGQIGQHGGDLRQRTEGICVSVRMVVASGAAASRLR